MHDCSSQHGPNPSPGAVKSTGLVCGIIGRACRKCASHISPASPQKCPLHATNHTRACNMARGRILPEEPDISGPVIVSEYVTREKEPLHYLHTQAWFEDGPSPTSYGTSGEEMRAEEGTHDCLGRSTSISLYHSSLQVTFCARTPGSFGMAAIDGLS